ncbi:hypothetical protein OEZ85_002890 [Tetradesmus obliquus]|uniref:Pectinesterase inhibitor domain-containing protein n=1 Tax=Tetradesmus obliquus TaxID=3088 RepID=A0ABY8U1L6_TETOB|nr:hypothetical protein OEZ85_002890 [Tetradesmus obliquus]
MTPLSSNAVSSDTEAKGPKCTTKIFQMAIINRFALLAALAVFLLMAVQGGSAHRLLSDSDNEDGGGELPPFCENAVNIITLKADETLDKVIELVYLQDLPIKVIKEKKRRIIKELKDKIMLCTKPESQRQEDSGTPTKRAAAPALTITWVLPSIEDLIREAKELLCDCSTQIAVNKAMSWLDVLSINYSAELQGLSSALWSANLSLLRWCNPEAREVYLNFKRVVAENQTLRSICVVKR